MRLLKAQNTNLRNIYGNGVKYDVNGQVIFDSTNTILVPKGTEAQRPTTPNNGHLRYNTDDDQFEAYQNGAWRELRFKEPNQDPGITQQNLGNGDATETVFGPLASGDTDYPVPAAAQNILVFVENVFQISTTNYTLVQSVSGNLAGPNSPYADGWYIKFIVPPTAACNTIGESNELILLPLPKIKFPVFNCVDAIMLGILDMPNTCTSSVVTSVLNPNLSAVASK